MKPIKPEDILSPPEMVTVLFAMFISTVVLTSYIIHWFDSTGVPYDPIYYVMFGLMLSMTTIAGVAYIRASLLTREKDLSIFAEMYSLVVIALSPLLLGMFKMLPNDPILTAQFDISFLYIPSVYDLVCMFVTMMMLVELYFTIRTYRRNDTSTRITEI